MNELKYQLMLNKDMSYVPVYLKSEADKVIAGKDKEIAELQEKLDITEKLLNKALDCISNGKKHMIRLARKNNHTNYKRCLAMAKWCERKRIDAADYRISREKWNFYDNWLTRWLGLAEQFKDKEA